MRCQVFVMFCSLLTLYKERHRPRTLVGTGVESCMSLCVRVPELFTRGPPAGIDKLLRNLSGVIFAAQAINEWMQETGEDDLESNV